MLKRIKRHSIIQAAIFVILAFAISILLFPETSITSKLFMFFMGAGCGISLSGCLLVRRNR